VVVDVVVLVVVDEVLLAVLDVVLFELVVLEVEPVVCEVVLVALVDDEVVMPPWPVLPLDEVSVMPSLANGQAATPSARRTKKTGNAARRMGGSCCKPALFVTRSRRAPGAP
jgi:hypothetical protein